MKFHEDDRAQRLLNVYTHLDGQINISYINSVKHIVAWHKHNIQTDYWICLKGSLKVGLAEPVRDGYSVRFEYLSDKNLRVLEIPPGVYHGYKALEPNSILMYHMTEKYNLDDEIREQIVAFGETWETENK